MLNCGKSRFAVVCSGIWQPSGKEASCPPARGGRERRLVVAAAVGFEGRRRWEEEEGSCWSWDPALGSCRSWDYCGWICMCCLSANTDFAQLTIFVLQTPILLTPSPLLSSIHFWSTLSPVAPLSPARLQGANTLFQVSSSELSQSPHVRYLCRPAGIISPNYPLWKQTRDLFSVPCVPF